MQALVPPPCLLHCMHQMCKERLPFGTSKARSSHFSVRFSRFVYMTSTGGRKCCKRALIRCLTSKCPASPYPTLCGHPQRLVRIRARTRCRRGQVKSAVSHKAWHQTSSRRRYHPGPQVRRSSIRRWGKMA